jgi:hypothetical protein
VARGQDQEVRYEAKKTGRSKAAVKRAVKKAGPSRRKMEKTLRSLTPERPLCRLSPAVVAVVVRR